MSPSLDVRENRELASEIKFRVPQSVGQEIRDWARGRLSPDPNVKDPLSDGYQITSLYFDTAEFDVFHRRGSFGRSKYRIRRYGSGDIAFLERKLKTRGMVTKRRSPLRLEELSRLAQTEAVPGWTGFWYHQRLLARQLMPICQIGYQRTARVAMSSYGPIRLTLDHDIRTLPLGSLAFHETAGIPILEEEVIVELKFRLEMPTLFKELAERFALTPRRISKYRLAVSGLGLASEPEPEEQGVPQSPPTTQYA